MARPALVAAALGSPGVEAGVGRPRAPSSRSGSSSSGPTPTTASSTRGHGRALVQARPQGQVRQRHQRRHRPPRDRRRHPRPPPHRRGQEVRRDPRHQTEVLDIHDGELMPTLENRRTITRKIREWQADVVISPPSQRLPPRPPLHRHPRPGRGLHGHRPELLPRRPGAAEEPGLPLLPRTDFQKPNPFAPDVVVPIDAVLDQKVAAIDALESQFYEWNPWLVGYLGEVPTGKDGPAGLDPEADAAKRYGGRRRPVPRQAGRAARRREGQGRQVCRGVRDLRVRQPAVAPGAAHDSSRSSTDIDRRCARDDTGRALPGRSSAAVDDHEVVPAVIRSGRTGCSCSRSWRRDSRRSGPEAYRRRAVRRSAGGGPCRGRRPPPCGPRG